MFALLYLLMACHPSDSDTEADTAPGDTWEGTCLLDEDEDGYCADEPMDPSYDCDDADPEVHPGVQEICNGVDDNCVGGIDEGLSDTDGDGLCDGMDEEECDCLDNDGNGWVDEGFTDTDADGVADCCDEEECDGLDNDGDGEVDEGFDDDGDGSPSCYDCDDGDAEVYPGATEDPTSGRDEDCDGMVDETAWEPGDLVIVELMTEPAWTSDIRGEWIELLNVSGRRLVMDGLVLVDASTDRHVFGALEIEADARVVIAREADPDWNGGFAPVYEYDGVMMGETDELRLQIEDSVLGTVIIDEVIWNHYAWPSTFGASKNLDPDHENAVDNDSSTSWCPALLRWSDDSDKGSPGEPNHQC